MFVNIFKEKILTGELQNRPRNTCTIISLLRCMLLGEVIGLYLGLGFLLLLLLFKMGSQVSQAGFHLAMDPKF